MFRSTLLNIVLFLPNKSSTSNYCPNVLLKLRFCFVSEAVTSVAPSWPCPLKRLLLSRCPLTSVPPCCPLLPAVLRSRDILPWVFYSPGCSVAAESCQGRESYRFSCTSVTDAVGMSKQTPCFPLKKTIPFTSMANVWHFNRALQDHGHKARFWVAQADVAPGKWARAAAGASRAPLSPISFSADCSKWPRAVGGTESQSLMASLLEAFIISVAEGTPIHLKLIPAFCSTRADWYSLCWESRCKPSPPRSTCSYRAMKVGFHILWWRTLNNQISLRDI